MVTLVTEKNIIRTAPPPKKLPAKTPFFQPGVDKELPAATATANPFAPPGASMPPLPPPSEESVGSEESFEPVVSPEYIPTSPLQESSGPAYIPPSPAESVEIETEELPDTGEKEGGEETSILTTIVENKQEENPTSESNIKKIN